MPRKRFYTQQNLAKKKTTRNNLVSQSDAKINTPTNEHGIPINYELDLIQAPEQEQTQPKSSTKSLNIQKHKLQKPKMTQNPFDLISEGASKIVGSSTWFMASLGIIAAWLLSGIFIGYGPEWHSTIHSITSVITLIIMALLHSSQRKWEERMVKMENHQEIVLNLLEKNTEEIKEDLDQYENFIQKQQEEKREKDIKQIQEFSKVGARATTEKYSQDENIPKDTINSLF
jgi:low affinity Fe/Cu permease